MRLTITTLVIVEDIHDPQSDDMSICYHSFKEDPEAAKSELISDVNALYAPSIYISMYGHYIACKSLDISSEEEYMDQLTDIKLICNEL